MRNFCLVFFLVLTTVVNGQIISFPDANFKAKLLQANVALSDDPDLVYLDANSDGELEVSEVANVWQLDVSNSNISNLSGLEYFTALKFLDCSNNSLTSITIAAPIAIASLNASHNLLTSVTVNWDTSDESGLDLSYNNLTSFTIVPGDYYDTINLSHNQLTDLTINNANISYFYVDYNNLSSIQVMGYASVYFSASFRHNQFSLLDLSLFQFGNECNVYLGYNTIDNVYFNEGIQPGNIYYSSDKTFFDLGNYSVITSCDPEYQGFVRIEDSPNLQQLILKNGFNHTTITCDEGGNIFENSALLLSIVNCPDLSFICVDEGERPNIQDRINQLGLQNQIQVNSYCSFTPGGEYYSVTGDIRYDSTGNGCDTNDFAVPFQEFTITNGNETGTIISDATGMYSLNLGGGMYTITPILQNPSLFTLSPSSVTANFPSQTSPLNQSFCLSATVPMHDFDVTLIPNGPAVPGFEAHYALVYKNTGNVIDTGNIVLHFNDNTLDFVSASTLPIGNTNGVLSWTFSNLMPFESRTINVTFNLNSPMDTPPLNADDILSFNSSIAETGASQPYLNDHTFNQTVVNSFDPNDKVCLEGENLSSNYIGEYVSYRIRFENTGTFPAQNVVIKDVIDATKFDVATLTPISGSHNFFTRINGNVVEFIFHNINLPFDDANNDGYVVFKIKLLSSVTQGVTFSNQASIYFDYNFPIVTNTASSVINTLGQSDFDSEIKFTISPIPVKNSLTIQANQLMEIKSIEIYNSLGQIVQKEIGNQHQIDVSALAKGSYFIRLRTANNTSVKQFLKE